jgi:hypothetical protein
MAVNSSFGALEVKCSKCNRESLVELAGIERPASTELRGWKLPSIAGPAGSAPAGVRRPTSLDRDTPARTIPMHRWPPHGVSRGNGRPVIFLLTEGQMSDHQGAALIYPMLPAGTIIADKGYDSDAFRDATTAAPTHSSALSASRQPLSFGSVNES